MLWSTNRRAVAACVLACAAAMTAVPAHADPVMMVYVPLDQPCRLLDTRSPGPGALTAAHGNYLFGTSDADIESAAQHGNSAGCGIPASVTAISVSINQLNTTNAGNIRTWSTDNGTTGPSAGTAVYNPSVSGAPAPGQVLYNPGSLVIPVGHVDQRFYVAVANGQLDMTINVTGYWQGLAWMYDNSGLFSIVLGRANIATGGNATAMGLATEADGGASTALNHLTTAGGTDSLAAGYSTYAQGDQSTALGNSTTASGLHSTSLGNETTASGEDSLAAGNTSTASGQYGIALGNNATASGKGTVAIGSLVRTTQVFVNSQVVHNGSIAFGDGSTFTESSADNQFMARAIGGVVFYTSTSNAGVQLAAGSGSWTTLSDRHAKDTIEAIDPSDVLDRVVALPLSTWHYSAQDAQFRHLGPMAQDFRAAFGLGESDTGIDTVDADGVALAAIQGLYARLEEKDRRIAALEARLDALAAQVAATQAATHAQP